VSAPLRLAYAGLSILLMSVPHSRAADARLEIGGGGIDVSFPNDTSDFPRALAQEWIATAARAVTKYYGRFPIDHVVVRIRAVAGDRIGSGKTFGTVDGGVITVSVGRSTTPAHFHSDWLMTHEMVHLAFPSVAEDHHWIEEGLATYVEPIARVEIGNLSAPGLVGRGARSTPRLARSGRSRARFHAHLGQDLLGRRSLLPAG
jgi:hypothetical protein